MAEQTALPNQGEILSAEEHRELSAYAQSIFEDAAGNRIKCLGVARALAMITVDTSCRGDNPVAIFAAMLSDLAIDASRLAEAVFADEQLAPQSH